MTFISDNQPSEILEPGKKPFDFPASFIPPQCSSVLSFWLFPTAPVRRDHLNAMLFQEIFVQLVTVVCFIADKFFWQSGEKTAVQCRFCQLYLMGRSTCKANGDRKTGSIRNGHDSAALAPFCPADRTAPFLAGTKLPSINASRISIPPRSCKSAANSSTMRRIAPFFTHFWNHLWHVWGGGYRSGKSFHGAPVRKIHRMPFSTSRGSRGFRPRESFLRIDSKMTGSIFIHCLSVSSMQNFNKFYGIR